MNKIEYAFSNETGDAQITIYRVFPGIEVAFLSVHMSAIDFAGAEERFCDSYIGFHYCIEGRIEQESEGEFFYMMPGDCSVVLRDRMQRKYSFPLKHYHGVSIGIDTAIAPGKFTEFLDNPAVDPERVAKRLCGEHPCVVLRAVEPLKHIFTQSDRIPEERRADHLKIRLLELLYAMEQVEPQKAWGYEVLSVPRTQAELVKRISAYIAENLSGKLSLKVLTARFGVSETYLQTSFRAVYGMSVAAFIRTQKMQKAAQMLIHTDRSIDQIAEAFGYANESKFSAVFKKIMGDPPSVFRREHSKIRIL